MNILERLKELEKNAAPAPWHPINIYGNMGINNADFIAEIRNALPDLLSVIDAAHNHVKADSADTYLLLMDALAALEIKNPASGTRTQSS